MAPDIKTQGNIIEIELFSTKKVINKIHNTLTNKLYI
jgi:hypothetical protein